MAWNKKPFAAVVFLLAVAQFHSMEATVTGKLNFTVQNDLEENNNSSGVMNSFINMLKEKGQIIPKASEDSSSDGFAKSIWGAFLFSLIGIAALVAILILLLCFIFNEERHTSMKPKSAGNAPAPQNNNQANPNPRFKANAAAVPETRTYPQSATTSYGYDNQAMTTDYDGGGRATSVYPGQQEQYHSSLMNYNYRFNPKNSPFQQGMGNDDQHGQQTPPLAQENFSFSPPVPAPDYEPQLPVPDYEPQVPATTYAPAPMTPIIPVPITPIYSQSKSLQESEYNSGYYEQPEEPFQYLDNYSPYSGDLATDNDQNNMNELATKRAVLRNSTPYQTIEERVQGEDYDDRNTFIHPTRNGFMVPPPPQSNLSSDSFNDGKTRKVRVLPPIHHHAPSQEQQPQPGGGSMAVFQSVAPVPPPPPPQQSQSQQPIYAVPRRQF